MNQLLQTVRKATPPSSPGRIRIAVADEKDRKSIYKIRHSVYAEELRQFSRNEEALLKDSLDEHNIYIVAKEGASVAGFISITPPRAPTFSIDKYSKREALPFRIAEDTFELRLLTVMKEHRGRELATLLMYAAFRWVESHGGDRIIAIGRREILELYLRVGLQPTGFATTSGEVAYDLLTARVDGVRKSLIRFAGLMERVQQDTEWGLSFPFRKPAPCFHGGAFFSAIGESFAHLERKASVINADVLDAWFAPAPRVVEALQQDLPWLLRTSPPTSCAGLIQALAEGRGVDSKNILPGAGSSDLIFRAMRQWLKPSSHALILDPTYGEYAHVLEQVIGCVVDRLPLDRDNHYAVDLQRLEAALADGYDLVVLVNPNSPTGQHIPRRELEKLLGRSPQTSHVWVDETYVEYAGPDQSLERFAAASENVIVCISMSKVYALSGARVAYLCAGAHQLEELRAITPPWVVGLPSQVAAVKVLGNPNYYAERYAETKTFREELALGLQRLGWSVNPGIANFLLCHLPETGPAAAHVVHACRAQRLFVRDAALMGSRMGTHTIRIAVKERTTNERMLQIIEQGLRSLSV
jgi:histidinol-phosphate/aromatic aminotransferase/cobyric acid decarboxylase-like protein/GNAT superfamily N-acetyltransferase